MKNILNVTTREHTAPDLHITYRLSESAPSVYSITVETDTPNTHEIVSVDDITRNRTEAEHIFRLLAEHLVTTCTVRDVLEDIL